MDKSVVNNIWRDINCVETIPITTSDIVKDCKFLLGEVERLESRHKADQKAVEEANSIAEDYRKKLNTTRYKLFDAKNEIGFFETSYESIRKMCVDLQDKNAKLEKALEDRAIGMAKRVHEIESGVIHLEDPKWENISKIVKDEKLKYLNTYSTKDLVDELKKRKGVNVSTVAPYMKLMHDVEGPAIVLTVID